MAEETEPEVPEKEVPEKIEDDPCDQTPVDATAICNEHSKAEGSGSYTQVNPSSQAYGRYQFDTVTGPAQAYKVRPELGQTGAVTLWNDCKGKTTDECKKLQDDMCKNYTNELDTSLKAYGITPTSRNRYLAWNMGAKGASEIIAAGDSDIPASNQARRTKMAAQAWNKQPSYVPTYNGTEFLRRMGVYLSDRGYGQS